MAGINVNFFFFFAGPVVFIDPSRCSSGQPPFAAPAPGSQQEALSIVPTVFSKEGSISLDDTGRRRLSSSKFVEKGTPPPLAAFPAASHASLDTSANADATQSPADSSPRGVVEHVDPAIQPQDDARWTGDSDPQSKPIFDEPESCPESPAVSLRGRIPIRQSLLDSFGTEDCQAPDGGSQKAIHIIHTPCTPRLVDINTKAKRNDTPDSNSPTSIDSAIDMDCGDASSVSPSPSYNADVLCGLVAEYTADQSFENDQETSGSSPSADLMVSSTCQCPIPAITMDPAALDYQYIASEWESSPEKEVALPALRLRIPHLRLTPPTEPPTPADGVASSTSQCLAEATRGNGAPSPKRTAYANTFPSMSQRQGLPLRNLHYGLPQVKHSRGPSAPVISDTRGLGRRNDQAPALLAARSPRSRPRLETAPSCPAPVDTTNAKGAPERSCRSSSLPQGGFKRGWKDFWSSPTTAGHPPSKPGLKSAKASTPSSLQAPWSPNRKPKSNPTSAPMNPLGIIGLPPGPEVAPPVPEKDHCYAYGALSPPHVKQFDPDTQTPPPGSSFHDGPGNRDGRYYRAGGNGPPMRLSAPRPRKRLPLHWSCEGPWAFQEQMQVPAPDSDSHIRASEPTMPGAPPESCATPANDSQSNPGPARRLGLEGLTASAKVSQPKVSHTNVPGPEKSFLLSPLTPRSPFSPFVPASQPVDVQPSIEDVDFEMARRFYLSGLSSRTKRENSMGALQVAHELC